MLTATNMRHLTILKDVFDFSRLCSTRTYIWGGLVQDVLAGEFLREHSDVDGFTLNLWNLQKDLAALFEQKGYTVSFVEDMGFLKIEYNETHAVFNQLEFDEDIALWRHAGNEGTVYFPRIWLCNNPYRFYDTEVFVSGVEFEYSIKARPQLLNPLWKGREKDIKMIEWLNRIFDNERINREEILKQIWSYNPYWVKKGYQQYSMPAVAWKLEPL